MQLLMNVIMTWISVTTGLPVAAVQPEVRYMPPEQLAELHLGPEQLSGRESEIFAVYIPAEQTIVLRQDWDSSRPADVSALVHELVHHMQHAAGWTYPCPEAAEALAYNAQNVWLGAFDLDLESAFGIDAFSLATKTTCAMY